MARPQMCSRRSSSSPSSSVRPRRGLPPPARPPLAQRSLLPLAVNTFILFNVFVAVLLDKAPLPPPLAPPPPASVAIAAIASSLSIFSAAPSGRHTPGADTNGAPTPRR